MEPAPQIPNALKDDPEMCQEVKRNNELITQLTDVILEPVIRLTGFKKRFLSNAIQMKYYFRRHMDDLYIFTVSIQAQPAVYKLEFVNDTPYDTIEVIGEDRAVIYNDGGIIDTFTTSETAHIYCVKDYFLYNISSPGEKGEIESKSDLKVKVFQLSNQELEINFKIQKKSETYLKMQKWIAIMIKESLIQPM